MKRRPVPIHETGYICASLAMVSGFLETYTYLLKGGVFANAQTGNFALLGMAIAHGDVKKVFTYLIPMCFYVIGIAMTVTMPRLLDENKLLRWDTVFVALEIGLLFVVGCLPKSVPFTVSTVTVAFICAMQYNTFRQAEGTPMATTFATNHIRQVGVGLAKEIQHFRKKDKKHREKWGKHCMMVVYFLLGVVFGTVACNIYSGKAIWITLLPFLIVLIDFLNEDLHAEEEKMRQKPHGH